MFTPLLASTCVGTLEFRSVTESVRAINKPTTYYQGLCTTVDLQKQQIVCQPTLPGVKKFSLPYDKLILAVGAKSSTFGTPGVTENAFFLKEIEDARKIRHRILLCFEQAKSPGQTPKQIKETLHFGIVGGGPTGVEFSAELHDLIHDDLSRVYPDLIDLVSITVFDHGDRILGSFDQKLADYATKKFARDKINVASGSHVEKIDPDAIWVKGKGRIGVGMIVWAGGIGPRDLTTTLGEESLMMNERKSYLLSDNYLHPIKHDGTTVDNLFVLGDCGTIKDCTLPSTAQVALQQAQYLTHVLNKPKTIPKPFQFANYGMMAYIGGWRAIADLRSGDKHWPGSGWVAWVIWRSIYFVRTVSWRNKILVPMYWILTWLFGRDISRI